MLNEVVKRTVCDELVKKVKTIQAVDAGNLVKKLTMTQKLVKLKKKFTDHGHSNKYITAKEFNDLAAVRLTQHKTTKADIDDFVGKTDFDETNNTKQVETEKKLTNLK